VVYLEKKTGLVVLPVLEFLDNADVIAPYCDRDGDDTLIEFNRNLFFCRINTLDHGFLSFERPRDQFNNSTLRQPASG